MAVVAEWSSTRVHEYGSRLPVRLPDECRRDAADEAHPEGAWWRRRRLDEPGAVMVEERSAHLHQIVSTEHRTEFRVVDVATDGSLTENDALRIAAAVERDSEHTIAQGIVKSAEEQALNVPKADQFKAIPGHGVKAVVEGNEFHMGGPAMLKRLAVTPSAAVREAAERAAMRGRPPSTS